MRVIVFAAACALLASIPSINGLPVSTSAREGRSTVKFTEAPDTWQLIPSENAILQTEVHIALPIFGEDKLKKLVAEVSDPNSPRYGQYVSKQELDKIVQVDTKARNAVVGWLHSNGVTAIDSLQGYLRFTVTQHEAAELFGVKLQQFASSSDKNLKIVRSVDEVTVPSELAWAVKFVSGINGFPTMREQPVVGLGAPMVTPDLLYKLYNMEPSDAGSESSSMAQALAEFTGQGYSASDLSQFQKKFGLQADKINKYTGHKTLLGHTEANLDVQYIMATGRNVTTNFWLQKGMGFDLVAWAADIIENDQDSKVWSVSYGEDIYVVEADYAQRLDSEFQKLAAMGITVVVASGDSGVLSRQGKGKGFQPSFPACLPSVTAVGATQLNKDGKEDSAVNWSGGGFSPSTYFSQPTWQSDAVKAYFNSGVDMPPAEKFDAQGRGFPDVSAVGVNYKVFVDHIDMSVSGTSASCPVFAGMLAVINNMRAAAGKPTLGFVNPALYQAASAFNDITQGKNNQGSGDGFNCAKGWDPVTGLGSPNFQQLKQALL